MPSHVCGRREYDFLAFVPYFLRSLFLLPYPDMLLFLVFLRLCSSHLLLSSK